MRANRASTTAELVAMWRALADSGATTVPDFRDAEAVHMLGRRARWILAATQRRLRRLPEASGETPTRTPTPSPSGWPPSTPSCWRWWKAGCRQVVILGAGFDTRAYRFEALRGIPFFEVDHPATQEAKRRRVASLPPPLARVIWTPVDFERDALEDGLARAGHDPAVPTVWIWEGVVMYLADAAVRSSLDAVRRRSAKGSVLITHYHEPSAGAVARQVRKLIFSWLGEPHIGLRSRDATRALIEAGGFAVRADLGIEEQSARLGAVAPTSDPARVSRITIAQVSRSASRIQLVVAGGLLPCGRCPRA